MKKSRILVWLPLMGAVLAACGDEATAPTHLSHPLVGTYDVVATYPSRSTSTSATVVVMATLTGTLVVDDTVETDGSRDNYFFPSVRLSAVFCSAPGTCTARQSWTAFTSLFAPNTTVTFGFGGIVSLEAPFADGALRGSATHSVNGSSRDAYHGTFTATRRR